VCGDDFRFLGDLYRALSYFIILFGILFWVGNHWYFWYYQKPRAWFGGKTKARFWNLAGNYSYFGINTRELYSTWWFQGLATTLGFPWWARNFQNGPFGWEGLELGFKGTTFPFLPFVFGTV